jgi:hypothetical protein
MGGIGLLRNYYFALLVVFSLLLAACGPEGKEPVSVTDSSARIYPIDAQFKNIDNRLENICGPGISPLFERKGKKYQYTISCLFVYDPNAEAIKRYSISPLGRTWKLEEPAESKPEGGEDIYVNGHVVWNEVVPYYTKFGAGVIGRPLTGVHFYPDQNRYAQYFENMGFYRFKDDPEGEIHLMPYGAWMCKDACRPGEVIPQFNSTKKSETTDPPAIQAADAAFNEVRDRLGRDFTGFTRSETYQAKDGLFEKVFDNLVMFSAPESTYRIQFRPLPQLTNIQPEPPVPPLNDPGMVFFPTLGQELGYNIPKLFMDYITMHGTLEISGNPITELHALGNGISRQCFTNICLEYHSKAPESLRVRPAALGSQYIQNRITPLPTATLLPPIQPTEEIAPTPKPTATSQALSLQVWERYPLLPPKQSQEIGVALFEGVQPLSNDGFTLNLSLPDGTSSTHVMLPTGPNGQTSVVINPLDVPIGTVIPYQVCITNLLDRPVCVSESFVIWDGQ